MKNSMLKYSTVWRDKISVDTYSSYSPRMTDYHMHDYFEISIIRSGHVNVLLTDSMESSYDSKVVLLRPYTPHYIYCEPDVLYSRTNVVFLPSAITDYVPEWQELIEVFGQKGAVLKITDEECEIYWEIANKIREDNDFFRNRILLLYLLSLLNENVKKSGEFLKMPLYISDALSYISSHYKEKIIASDLAQRSGVGRTTFMIAFKKYTGSTFNEYINRCRVNRAIIALKSGMTEQEVAEQTGFTDACNLIRSFKRVLGITPKKYLMSHQNEDNNM